MTHDDEDRELRVLFSALGIVSEWERMTSGPEPSGAWHPSDDSDLAQDDKAAHPYGVSHAAWAALTSAVSHLACLRDSLFVQTSPASIDARLHTHGQFTLVRGALENASRALWLLESDDRTIRLLRRLQQDWAEVRDMDKVRLEIGSPETKSMDARFAELSAVAQAGNVDPRLIKKTPDYTMILRTAGGHVDTGPTVAVVTWKACSSIAHGEARGPLNYLTREVLSESSSNGVALARLTSNVVLLYVGVMVAIRTTKAAFDFYAKRSNALEAASSGEAPRQP